MNVQMLGKDQINTVMFVAWLANVRMVQSARKTGATVPPTLMPLFWGDRGIGKSSLIKGFQKYHAEKFGKSFFASTIKVNLASMDGADFEMPVPHRDKGEITRLTVFKFDKQPQIILVDEVNRFLNTECVNAFSRIVLDRDGAVVPADGSMIVACANPVSMGGTKELPEHLANRCCHIYLTEAGSNDANVQYIESVTQGKIPSWIAETLRYNEIVSNDDHVDYGCDTARAREYATWIAIAAEDARSQFGVDVSDKTLFALLAGVVGQSLAGKMMHSRKMAGLPTLGDVLASPDTVSIPDAKIDHGLRKNHALHLVSGIRSERDAALLMRYFMRFSGEFQRYAIERLAAQCPSLEKHHEYTAWAVKSSVPLF